jgi:hypothetical protein
LIGVVTDISLVPARFEIWNIAPDRRHIRLQPRHDRVLSQGRLSLRRVRQGYFDTYPVAVVENGLRARDMVMFQMPLTPSSMSNPEGHH